MAGFEPTTSSLPRKYTTTVLHQQIIKWSEYKDSNLGPPGPKPGALPDCATLRKTIYGS